MKIYGTMQSERATKSQGGNDKMSILLTVGNRNNPETLLKATVERTETETGTGLADKYVLWIGDIPMDSVIIDKK